MEKECINCLLLPLATGRLLVPAALVAHVQPLEQPIIQRDDGPPWLVGNIDWRNHQLPVIAPDHRASETIAILHTLEPETGPEFFACLLSELPRFLQFPRQGISWSKQEDRPLPCVVGAVQLDDGPAWIPDLEGLEAALQ